MLLKGILVVNVLHNTHGRTIPVLTWDQGFLQRSQNWGVRLEMDYKCLKQRSRGSQD